MIDKFLGLWRLDATYSEYQLGQPPLSGSYQIDAEDQKLTFTMKWLDAQHQSHEMAYSEVLDGEFHPYLDSPLADQICLKLTRPDLLESIAKKAGQIVLSARREHLVFEGREALKVKMSGPLPDGSSYTNTAYYFKAQD